MFTSIRFRFLASCFALIAGIVFAADLLSGGNPLRRTILELALCFVGAIVMTWIFSRSLAWRVQRLRVFTEHVLDSNDADAPLPDEGEETAVLNQSFRRMASRIRELVERLSLESKRRDAILKSMAEGVLAVDHQMRIMFCGKSIECGSPGESG